MALTPLLRELPVFNGKPAIAVLGPGQDPLDPDVGNLARDLGYSLAHAGYTVIGVGRQGVGGIAAAGAHRAKGHCVMVVSDETDAPDTDERSMIRTETPLGRIEAVLNFADGVMVLPGDLTALATVLEIWSYGLTRQGPYRQVVLTGPAWPSIVATLADAAALGARERAMMTFADTASEGVEALRYFVSPSPKE